MVGSVGGLADVPHVAQLGNGESIALEACIAVQCSAASRPCAECVFPPFLLTLACSCVFSLIRGLPEDTDCCIHLCSCPVRVQRGRSPGVRRIELNLSTSWLAFSRDLEWQ